MKVLYVVVVVVIIINIVINDDDVVYSTFMHKCCSSDSHGKMATSNQFKVVKLFHLHALCSLNCVKKPNYTSIFKKL